MVDITKATGGRVRELTDEELDGFELKKITCRGCSGYGNCGFKSYRLYQGKVVAICVRTQHELRCKRDGIPFEE